MSNIDSVDVRLRRILAVLACLCVSMSGMALYACAHDPNPMAALYGAEGMRCVYEASNRAEARECFARADALYSQDGGK